MKDVTALKEREIKDAASALTQYMVNRIQWAVRAGLSFGDKRDLYRAFGYDLQLNFRKYLGRYFRDGIAKRIVDAYPKATWRSAPIVYDDDKDTLESEFEKAWLKHVEDFNVYQVLERLDKLAGIGEYAVLVIGAPGDQTTPLYKMRAGKPPLYITPYGQGSATVAVWESNQRDPRYGRPVLYRIGMPSQPAATGLPNGAGSTVAPAPVEVHYTRVIHVAEDLLEGEIYGTPRLEAAWNDIDDLRKVTGGASEMFYIAGNRGLHVKFDPQFVFDDKPNVKAEVDEFMHEMTRVMTTQGVDIESLGSDVADPRGAVITNLQMLSAATGIPMRILTGSEMGQLASTQDRDNWNERVTERKNSFAKPSILKPYVRMMISLGVLPKPKGDMEKYHWPDLMAYSAEQRSVQALREATAEQYHSNAVKNGAQLLGDAEARVRWYDLDAAGPKQKDPNIALHPAQATNIKKANDFLAGKTDASGNTPEDANVNSDPNAQSDGTGGSQSNNSATEERLNTSANASADATIRLKKRKTTVKLPKTNRTPKTTER